MILNKRRIVGAHIILAIGSAIYLWRLRMLLVTKKKFKIALKKLLYTYSFYTLEEYFSQLWIKDCITRFLI